MFSVDLIIAIDPATSFGWAVFRVSGGYATKVASGALNTKGPWGARFNLASAHVAALLRKYYRPGQAVWIAYEDIQARTLRSWDNYRVISGLISSVYTAADNEEIPIHRIAPIPLASAKLHGTGDGRADKPKMVEYFKRKYKHDPETEDEADAAHIGSLLCEILHDRVKTPNGIAWRRIIAHHTGEMPLKPKKRTKRTKRKAKKASKSK